MKDTTELPTKPRVIKFIKMGSAWGVRKTKQHGYTNGHWIIRKEFASKAMLRRLETSGELRDDGPKYRPSEKDVTPKETSRAEYDCSIESGCNEFKTKSRFIDGRSGHFVYFNEDYIAYLQKMIKDFSLRISTPKTAAIIMSGNKKAGLLMPVMA